MDFMSVKGELEDGGRHICDVYEMPLPMEMADALGAYYDAHTPPMAQLKKFPDGRQEAGISAVGDGDGGILSYRPCMEALEWCEGAAEQWAAIEQVLEGYFCAHGPSFQMPGPMAYYLELNESTPQGEDWWETVWFDGTGSGFIKAVCDRAAGFDIDEEVEALLGAPGAPGAVALVHDAEWKQERLYSLAEELSKLTVAA